jgi:hypothetical protein
MRYSCLHLILQLTSLTYSLLLLAGSRDGIAHRFSYRDYRATIQGTNPTDED